MKRLLQSRNLMAIGAAALAILIATLVVTFQLTTITDVHNTEEVFAICVYARAKSDTRAWHLHYHKGRLFEGGLQCYADGGPPGGPVVVGEPEVPGGLDH